MTKLIFSIDTEVGVYDSDFDAAIDNPESQMYGRTPQGEYGIRYIMDKLAAHGCRGTFFLTPYEHRLWGEETLAQVARDITERGFDCQLHSHVDDLEWLVGARRKEIGEFGYEDQLSILRHGKDLLEKWTGKPLRWHRGGHLSCNRDTLRALEELGFFGDASFCQGWESCAMLGIDAARRNRPQRVGALWEMPLSTYRTLPCIQNYRHMDVNVSIVPELKKSVRQAIDGGLPYLVVLMHSNSFVRRVDGEYMLRDKSIVQFDEFLEFLSQQDGLEFTDLGSISADEIAAAAVHEPQQDLYSGYLLSYLRAAKQWRRGRKNQIFVAAPIVAALLALTAIFVGVA